MAPEGQDLIEKIVPIGKTSEVQTTPFLGVVMTKELPGVVERRKNLVAHILRADQTIDFMKLILFFNEDDIISFLSEQKERGNESVFFDFLDFLKQEFFRENNPIPENIISIIYTNTVLKGYILDYIKDRNRQVLSEQNIEQYETASFHFFLLGMEQKIDIIEDIRVNKLSSIEALLSDSAISIWEDSKMQLKIRNKSREGLDQKLDSYIALCETANKLRIIHSINLDDTKEREITFGFSSIIEGKTQTTLNRLLKNSPNNIRIKQLKYLIARITLSLARKGATITGGTRQEIQESVLSVRQKQDIGYHKASDSDFCDDHKIQELFSAVFEGEKTCLELTGLDRVENIYGTLNKDEEAQKEKLISNLLFIYNFWIDSDVSSSTSLIDDFITRNHLKNEFQIETVYHIVCFDKKLDEWILSSLLRFLISRGKFSNSLYEQFAVKIIEQIIKRFTGTMSETMSETRSLIDEVFVYLQNKNNSNFILGYSRVYLALAYYYIGLPDEISMILAQEAYLHFANLGSVKDKDVAQMNQKEQRFYILLGERGLKNLGIPTVLSTEEKAKIGQKFHGDFVDGYEIHSINTIRTEVLGLISALNTSDDVYSAKEINELIGQKIAEKLFDNLCTISIIGECKNCIHQGDSGEIISCSNDKTQCKSRKMKKGYQAEYIDISNGLSIQFVYPVVSTHIFERMFTQKREMIKGHFENLIASNTKNEKLTRLAFHDGETDLPNRNKLEEELVGKERTMAFLEVADYSTILGLHGGRENWLELSRQIADHFSRLSGATLYRYNEKIFCLVFSPESIERVGQNVDSERFGRIITTILDGIIFEFSATYNRSIQFHTGIIIGQKENHTEYAHIALTEAKNPRHHGPYVFKEGDEKKPEQTHHYTSILEKALDDNNKDCVIMPHYQRIYDPRNPHRKSIEALARMEIPSDTGEKQLVGAHNFIGIATNKKWLSKITRKMIEQIIEDMRQDPDLEVSINIHEQDWNDEGIMAWFRWIYENNGIETKRITIEILENVPLDKWDDLDINNKRIDGKDKKQVQELRDLGYKIAIDDYGAHGGSAEKIKKLKPDKIKLDRSVVEGLRYQEDKKESIAIIRHTVNMAREIGAEVIAEYVENKEIYEILLELGVDYFQGWYFAKAVPLEEVEWGELKAA